MDKELLAEHGIDYEKGLRNCMGNEDFYKKILTMFLEDSCFKHAIEAHDRRNYQELFSCMHELKGVSGSVALTKLYETIVPIVALLRKETDDDAEVDSLFAAVEAAYNETCNVLHKCLK